VVKLQNDFSRERQMCTRLAKSHRSLTRYLHDMEVAVEVEKEQV